MIYAIAVTHQKERHVFHTTSWHTANRIARFWQAAEAYVTWQQMRLVKEREIAL